MPGTSKIKAQTSGAPRAQRSRNLQGDGPNWVLIAGGALISTLSVRLGYKIRQMLDPQRPDNTTNVVKAGSKKTADSKRERNCHLHSTSYAFAEDGSHCFNCISGTRDMMEVNQQHNGQVLTKHSGVLPLVAVSTSEFSKENGIIWSSSPDRLELPQKPFHHSNSSDSPCVSESGSESFTKREVIQKLRQQLKRRDDTILEMQEQIVELQNSLDAQFSYSSNLQSLLDASNRELFNSEREIQGLRKVIADHCLTQVGSCDKPSSVPAWQAQGRDNGNGHLEVEGYSESSENYRGEGEKIEMLKKEVAELKEVMQGKDYLLQNYKEQKSELSLKIVELQHRFNSQSPSFL